MLVVLLVVLQPTRAVQPSVDRRCWLRRSGLVAGGTTGLFAPAPALARRETPDWLRDVPVESLGEATSKFVERDVERQAAAEEAAALARSTSPSGQAALQKEAAAVARAKARGLAQNKKPPSDRDLGRRTETVRLAVRVARRDGSFETRPVPADSAGMSDDINALDATPVSGAVDIALFGDEAPANVALFLAFALRRDDISYARSVFDEVAEDGALVVGGRVKGLEERDVFGERVLVFRNAEVLASNEDRKLAEIARRETTRTSHSTAGLVTRRRVPPRTSSSSSSADDDAALLRAGALASAPESTLSLVDFGVTLRAAPELDAEWTVIGRIMPADDDATADAGGFPYPGGFVERIKSLPVYAGAAVGDFSETTPFAAQVFKAERNAFRGVATAIGDTRVSNVFPGKLLRRVEVTRTELL